MPASRKRLFAAAIALTVMAGAPAEAAGCLKGAVVGGVAGHFAHHTILGAVAGCAIGHHMAVKQKQEEEARQQALKNQHGAPPPH